LFAQRRDDTDDCAHFVGRSRRSAWSTQANPPANVRSAGQEQFCEPLVDHEAGLLVCGRVVGEGSPFNHRKSERVEVRRVDRHCSDEGRRRRQRLVVGRDAAGPSAGRQRAGDGQSRSAPGRDQRLAEIPVEGLAPARFAVRFLRERKSERQDVPRIQNGLAALAGAVIRDCQTELRENHDGQRELRG
jgi:hypothetical protein